MKTVQEKLQKLLWLGPEFRMCPNKVKKWKIKNDIQQGQAQGSTLRGE